MSGDKALVPELRFPEFAGAWKPAHAGDAFSNSRTKGEAGLPIWSVTLDRGLVPRDTLDRHMGADAADETNLRAQAGDLVYNMMRMWQGAVGIATEECMLSPAYVVLSPKEETSSKFFDYWFKNSRMLYLLWAYSHGLTSDRLRLYYQDFAKIPIALPTLPEQQKIAAFLDAVSKKITLLTQKREALTDYKRGLMQRLFSGARRFTRPDGSAFPDWEERKLGELGSFTGGGTPDTNVDGFWTGDIAWVSSSDISENNIHAVSITRRITDEAVKESATQITPKGAILIVTRVGIGKCAIAPEDLCTSQDFTNFVPHTGNARFFAYWLHFHKRRLLSLAQGTSIKGVTTVDLKRMLVEFPHPEEQTKIADALSALDARIDAVSAQISQMEAFKKGLLQKMFV